MSFIEFHVEGGIQFMAPLALLLFTILGLTVYLFLTYFKSKQLSERTWEVIRQLGALALAWGAFGTLVGLFEAFGDLSEMTEELPFPVIMGGLKVALYTTLYGFAIFIVAQLVGVVAKILSRNHLV
jgi:flagellar motor component MotA